MWLSPEIGVAGSLRLQLRRGPCRPVAMARWDGAAGVEEQGIGTGGFPRNMGGPVVSPEKSVTWGAEQCPQACGGRIRAAGANLRMQPRVPPSEGNEVRRDGRPGVVAP